MVQIGYTLSSEEHEANTLVRNAQMAEDAGFAFLSISDHFHPWVEAQGHAPFVWAVIGGIAPATERIPLGTGVTCPTVRTHPAIIAHAAATVATMMPGRFFLGVGSGEALNEHITGERWPETEIRLEMMEEAVEVIRLLWQGGNQSFHGTYYTIENARIYDLPEEQIPIVVSATGPKAAEVAGRIGDGLWNTSPDKKINEIYERAGGSGPRYVQVTVCWGENRDRALQTAHRIWPNSAIPGELSQELPTPTHFEQAAKLVTPEKVAEGIVLGTDPQPYLEKVEAWVQAGYDHIYFHQIGPDQEGFIRFAEREILPRYSDLQSRRVA